VQNLNNISFIPRGGIYS